MEAISKIDAEVFLWINSWVGTVPIFDRVVQWVVSDYLVPVAFSLLLLGLWFGWRGSETRERHQRGVMLAGIGVGVASAAVKISNLLYFRPRPFDALEVELLFYAPTDSSFPANPVAVAVAMATGVWVVNRRLGTAMYVVATLYGLSRIYSGVFYPLDVVGGAAIAIAAVYLTSVALRLIEPVPTICLRWARLLCLA